MNLFYPRTFSTDWELLVIDKLERCVDEAKLMAFAGVLSQKHDLPVQVDWDTLELAMGINTSFEQLWRRIQDVTDRAGQLLGEYDLDLFPAAAQPTGWLFNASHVHVGTIHDEGRAVHLENELLKYAPAFAALAANSPISHHRRGEFKSYRVRHRAHGCTRPGQVRDPELYQYTWGTDAGAQIQGKPTMEVRITDCASSRRFLAELATFIAAFLHHLGTKEAHHRPSTAEYQNCMTNRWSAARHGMQATFLWDGAAAPVAEVLNAMLDDCREELSILGATREDLRLISAMIAKRTCQADFALDLAGRYPDCYCLSSAYAKLLREWTVIDEWLEAAPALEPVPLPDEAAIMAEHLALVGEGTYFYRTREAMSYPPPIADAILDRLAERGDIRREVTAQRGILLHRTRD